MVNLSYTLIESAKVNGKEVVLNDFDKLVSLYLNSNSDIKSEYDKLYKRYSNKYSDEYKLKTTIKSKLYQKGYSIEEINKIIE